MKALIMGFLSGCHPPLNESFCMTGQPGVLALTPV
jgi:hypothetical protein